MAYEPLIGQARLAKRMRKEMQCDPQWVLDLAAERDTLKHALDVKEEFYQDALHSHIVLAQQRDQLLAEVEALRKDAERYTWWRDRALRFRNDARRVLGNQPPMTIDEYDAETDAAMAAKEGV